MYLASFPSPAQGVWHLGWLPIRAYAFFIIVGIVVALVIGDRRWAARGGERGVIYDIALWAVPFGLIGGRLYHVITDWPTYFGDDGAGPFAALRIWDGGLGIWGAVALGGVGAWIGCRRHGIPLPAFGDAIAPGIILAQAIGRIGNYFNQELFGGDTTLPWGLEIYVRRNASGAYDTLNGVSTGQLDRIVHPTFLYELLWNLLVFVVLILVDRRFKFGHGRLFALYVAAYCVGRFWIELMRSDFATHIAGIRINSFTSMFVFIGAVVYIILAPKGREDPSTLGGRAAAEAEVEEVSPVSEVAKELTAVAASSGVVAAATVADQEDEAEAEEPAAEAEPEAEEAEAEVQEAAAEAAAAAEEHAADAEDAEAKGDEVGEAAEAITEPDEEAEAETETAELTTEPEEETEPETAEGAAEGEEAEAAAESEAAAEPEEAEADDQPDKAQPEEPAESVEATESAGGAIEIVESNAEELAGEPPERRRRWRRLGRRR